MSKYILTFLWGGITVAFWFLSFNKLGVSDMQFPNGFLFPAIISTGIAGLYYSISSHEKEDN